MISVPQQKKQPRFKVGKKIQHFFIIQPINNYIYSFANAIFYNQKALVDPQNCDESFIKTIFYFKSISMVKIIQSKVVILTLDDKLSPNFQINKIQERVKSLKSLQVKDFILKMKKFSNLFLESQKKNIDIKSLDFDQILDQFIKSSQKQKYFAYTLKYQKGIINFDKIVMSLSLLQLLGCQPIQQIEQYSKLKGMMNQFINHKIYFDCQNLYVDILTQLLEIILSEQSITLDRLKSKKSIHCTTSLFTKKNEKIIVDINFQMPMPFIFILRINKVFSKKQQFSQIVIPNKNLEIIKQELENQEKQTFRLVHYKRQLYQSSKICSYRNI